VAKLDTRQYPELSRQMARRERERNTIRSRRHLGDGKGDDILLFWQELSERIEEEEDLDNMEAILREIRGDIDMLRGLQQSLMISKEDSDHGAQIASIIRLISLLLDIYERYRKWHWHLREKALAYYMAVNPAMPSKAAEKYESKKDKKAAGQAKAKDAVEMTRQKEGAKKKQQPSKRPTKKMEA
jgi:hypothetical protein